MGKCRVIGIIDEEGEREVKGKREIGRERKIDWERIRRKDPYEW